MPGICAKLKIKEGKQQEFVAAAKIMQAAVAANEPGCHYYDLFASPEDSQTFVFLERYENDEAMAAHGKTDHMKAFGGSIGGLLEGAPVVERYTDT